MTPTFRTRALPALLTALALAGCGGGGSGGPPAPAPPAQAAPAVTGIAPTSGPAGTVVTVLGTGFVNVTAVRFGGIAAARFQVASPTQLTAVAPAGAGTANDITVVTASGPSARFTADRFSYGAPPAPAVGALSPAHGPATGGTEVTITGSGFTPSPIVSFGGASATDVLVVSSTQIVANTPSGAGTVDVTVADGNGVSATETTDRFGYDAPIVSAVSPTEGNSGTVVTITGSSFLAGATVLFGAVPATNVTVVSPTQITATAPAGAGFVNVTVSESSGVSVMGFGDLNQFEYVVPSSFFSDIIGSAGSGLGQFSGPLGVAVDNPGHVYVADTGNDRVEEFLLPTDINAEASVVSGAAPSRCSTRTTRSGSPSAPAS